MNIVSELVLLDVCPICGQSPVIEIEQQYTCPVCQSVLKKKRWLGLFPTNRFVYQTIGDDYSTARSDLLGRPLTLNDLKVITSTCYTDSDLKTIAEGEPAPIHLPNSTVASLIFEHTGETCYVQLNGLTRAQGPTLPNGTGIVDRSVEKNTLTTLDRGNLYLSNQRVVFPSDTHTIIRLDRKLTGVRALTNAFAVQRKGEDYATYFVGCQSRQAVLVEAFLRGQLKHLT
jgi:hypothetical protein